MLRAKRLTLFVTMRYDANDKKYTRYQMFSRDGVFAQEFEKKAWDENDAAFKRMKICVCCAETNSIKVRLDEIQKELDNGSTVAQPFS